MPVQKNIETEHKLNSDIKPGDTIRFWWDQFVTIISIEPRGIHPVVGKACVTFNFAGKPAMTAFLDDYSEVPVIDRK